MCGSMTRSFAGGGGAAGAGAQRYPSIEDLVPLLYPGVQVSYGTIQQMLVEAEGRAARLNAQASLGGVEAGRSMRCSARVSRCWPGWTSTRGICSDCR